VRNLVIARTTMNEMTMYTPPAAASRGETPPRRLPKSSTGRVWFEVVTRINETRKSVMPKMKIMIAPVKIPGINAGSVTKRNLCTSCT